MAKLLKLRRGTTIQHGSFAGAEGECTVDLNKDVLVVHDGTTNGGHPLAAEDMSNVLSTSIVSRVDASALAGSKVQPNFGSQNVETTGTLASGNHTVTGNIAVSGTVDGRDVATDGSKLDGIDTGAKDDQTAAEIRVLVGSASDSNVFTDADHGKLDALTTSNGVILNGVTTTTQAQSDNSTKLATTAYVRSSVASLIDSAPSALDTLNELAAALGDDANFASSTATAIGSRLPLGGGQMTGNITMSGTQTVDGRDLSVDGSKLDGIDAGATNVSNNNQITNGAGYTTYSSNQATDTTSNVNFASVTATGNITAYSDATLKTEIHTINDALGIVGKLRGVNYKWLSNGQEDIGVIAQEVQQVVPEVIKETEDGIKTVDYGRLVSVLINAVNELNEKLDEHTKGGK
ncbi:MAG: hypothetical protein CL815_04735 [Coraliomargarita sp.]|nr:hypothetical protein [Coraliomargarita sp.]